MSKAAKIIKENNFLIFISLIVIFVAFLPLFTVNCINGHDIEYHLLRIESLKEGILAGYPFLKVNMLYFGGRGYASSLFYPDFLLYIPAFFRCMGVSINASYHLFVGICFLLSFGFMYYAMTQMLNSAGADACMVRPAALLSAIVYVLAQYHIDDVYTRSAVGEYTAMIFLPFGIYGLYDLIWGEMKRPFMMVVGVSGVLLCHTNTLVFLLSVYIMAFILVILGRKFKLESFWRLLKAAFMTMVLTAFYYVPMLEQFGNDKFQTNAGGFDLDYEKLLLKDVFANRNPGLGIVLPLIVLIAGFVAYVLRADSANAKGEATIKIGNVMSGFALLFMLCSTGFLPWKRLQGILSFVQFPWRLFIMATVFMSVAAGMYIYFIISNLDADKRKAQSLIILVLTAGLMIFSAVNNISRIDEGYYSYSGDYYSYIPHTGNVIGGEWLPEAVTDREALLKDCDLAQTNLGEYIQVQREDNRIYLDSAEINGVQYVDVPFIYYKGYAAKDDSGRELRLDGSGLNGSVRVYLDGNTAGRIEVFYKGTYMQKLSGFLSMASLFFIAFWTTGRKKEKNLKGQDSSK